MSKSREPAEEIEFLRDVIARQRAEIERLHQEVATLREIHQGYRDEIGEYFREIERLRTALSKARWHLRRYNQPEALTTIADALENDTAPAPTKNQR